MKLLLHICCGPCATYPVATLRQAGLDPTGYFFNPNIHPYREYKKRRAALETYAAAVALPLFIHPGYDFQDFLRQAAFHEDSRCALCYHQRLQATAEVAQAGGFTHISTTLLVSPFQKHDFIHAIGESIAADYGLAFYYQDFRPGYRQGIALAQELDLYRQPYCGCIYSEVERYNRRYRKKEDSIKPAEAWQNKKKGGQCLEQKAKLREK